ncbi:MAG TPA: glycosyltransferase family 1 protein [Acidimicrobiia bacterium]|nr:glycosyltransferase family 1 protein [Acidimicrobiia bacterium]
MRVLVDVSAVPARPVGAGMYTVALASGLSAHGAVDLHLLTRHDDAERWSALAPTATVHASAPARRPVRLAWEQSRGPAMAEHVGADLWHGPHYTMPLRASVPCAVTIHDLTFFDHPEWHERSKVVYFRRMIRAAARRATTLICVSTFTADRLRALVAPRTDIEVIHHGVDHDRFAAKGDSTADLALLAGHGIEPPYIAFASTIEPRKNVPTLVRAFAKVAATRPELRLVLAGSDGWGAREASEAIAANRVATRVLRPGYLDNATIAAFFRRAAAVTYPSLEEGFGLPALEGLACGAPVVTSEGSALAEVVGDAALLVPPGDADALAGALARVLDDSALSERLRVAGPARAAEFTWKACVDQHVGAYERTVRAGAPV